MGNGLVKMDATASGTTTTNSTFDLADRLTSAGGSSYVTDANGNTLAGSGRVMTWDSQNRMVSCSYSGNTLAFDYGSDGLRRSETLTSGGQSVTTYYVYDGQSLVMEETKNAQGQMTASASYLNGPRGPEYKKDETTGSWCRTNKNRQNRPAPSSWRGAVLVLMVSRQDYWMI